MARNVGSGSGWEVRLLPNLKYIYMHAEYLLDLRVPVDHESR